MRRLRRLAIVLVAVGLVTSAIYATGAFSSLTTSRDANVNVAGDKAGYLGLVPGANGEYTTYQNGKLQLQLNGALDGEDAPRGGGVNREAETAIESVFTITNQGAQPVGVWLEDTDDHIEFERANGGSLEQEDNAVRLTPGDTVHVGLTIDTTDTDVDQLDTKLIVNADSDVKGTPANGGNSNGSPPENTSGVQSNENSPPDENKDIGETGRFDDDQYEDCGLLDGNCHKRNAETFVDGKKEEASELIGDLTKKEKAKKLIREFSDIENVIEYLKDNPALVAMLTGPSGMALAPFAYMYPEITTNFALGVLLGESGMPNGLLEVVESKSPYYLVGWLGATVVPEVGALFDARDLGQNVYSAATDRSAAEAGEAALDAISIAGSIAGYGIGDIPKVAAYTGKWAAKFGGKTDTLAKITSKYLFPYLSESKKLATLDVLTDGGASALKKKVDFQQKTSHNWRKMETSKRYTS